MWRTIVQCVKGQPGRNLKNLSGYDFAKSAAEGIHLVYTSPAATSVLLRAAEGFLSCPQTKVYIHAALPIPYHLELDNPLISIAVIEHGIGECVRHAGHPLRPYEICIYTCRSRIEGLLKQLPPASLVLLASHWRPWPTIELRMANALESAGHCVVSVHTKQLQKLAAHPTRIGLQDPNHAYSNSLPTSTR